MHRLYGAEMLRRHSGNGLYLPHDIWTLKRKCSVFEGHLIPGDWHHPKTLFPFLLQSMPLGDWDLAWSNYIGLVRVWSRGGSSDVLAYDCKYEGPENRQMLSCLFWLSLRECILLHSMYFYWWKLTFRGRRYRHHFSMEAFQNMSQNLHTRI